MPHPSRRCRRRALAAVATSFVATASAQYSGSIDVATRNRYRGADVGESGSVVRASFMADPTMATLTGGYGGISGVWRVQGGELEIAEALLGMSRRFNALPALSNVSPEWAWDAGVHLLHYGGNSRYDFHELIVGLLAPGWSARAWWSPHYFGGAQSSLYVEVNGSFAIADGWRLFAHAGRLAYGGGTGPRSPDRIDGLLGLGYAAGPWDFRLMRDGRTESRSRGAWVVGARFAF